jgi:hypothetical protein
MVMVARLGIRRERNTLSRRWMPQQGGDATTMRFPSREPWSKLLSNQKLTNSDRFSTGSIGSTEAVSLVRDFRLFTVFYQGFLM